MDRSTADGSRDPRQPSLSVAVVEAVAEREAVDPAALDQPLYDVVDPDALETLFPVDDAGRPRRGGHVTFVYRGHLVRVSADREVRIVGSETAGDGGAGRRGP